MTSSFKALTRAVLLQGSSLLLPSYFKVQLAAPSYSSGTAALRAALQYVTSEADKRPLRLLHDVVPGPFREPASCFRLPASYFLLPTSLLLLPASL